MIILAILPILTISIHIYNIYINIDKIFQNSSFSSTYYPYSNFSKS